jgi:hypothetical protein
MAGEQKYNYPQIGSGASSTSTLPTLNPTLANVGGSPADSAGGQTQAPAGGSSFINSNTGQIINTGTPAPGAAPLQMGAGWSAYMAPTANMPTGATSSYGTTATTPGAVSSDTYTSAKDKELSDLAKLESQTQRDQISAERERQIALETANYDQKLLEAGMKNEEQVGSEKAIQFRLGTAGTNIAGAETARANVYRANVISQLERSKADIIARIKNAASDDDWKAVNSLRTTLAGIQDRTDKLRQQDFENKLKINADVRAGESDKRANANLERQNLLADYQILGEENKLAKTIPAGETKEFTLSSGKKITLTGVDAKESIFSGSDIVSLAKDIPVGETRSIFDQGTGKYIEVKGIASPDVKFQRYQFTDSGNQNHVVAIDPSTNKVVSDTIIGTARDTRSSVTVNMPTYQDQNLYGAGGAKYQVWVDPKNTKNKIYYDAYNNVVDPKNLPPGLQFTEVKEKPKRNW